MAAPTLVAGVRARGSLATTREDTDYAMGISLLEPWTNPMTLLTMKLGIYTSTTIDTHWWEDQHVPYITQLNDASDMTDSDTTMTVDDPKGIGVGDLIQVFRTGEVVLVTANDGTDLTIVREYGQGEGWTSTNAAIVDDDFLRVIGNAFEQGHPLPNIITTKAVDNKNYCQDIRTPIGMSEIAIAAAHRGEADWPYQERKKAISHSRELEKINFYGKPYVGDKGLYVAATGNTLPTTAAGVDHVLVANGNTDLLVAQDDLTMFEFMDFLEAGFDKGSRTKFFYCPPKFRTGLEKWGITKMNTFAKQNVLGMNITTWDSAHGIVHFVTHDLLKSPAAAIANDCFLLDMENLSWIVYNTGMTKLRTLDPYKATGATKEEKEYQTIQCIRVKLPDTHARLRFKTISAT